MNILVINYEYPPIGGGAATFTRYLVNELSLRNHRVSVLTSKYGNLPDFEITPEGIKIYRVPSFRKSICECSLIGMLSFVTLGMLKIKQVVRELQPDICLNFFAQPCGILALYTKIRFSLPYVLCLRGGDVPGFSPEETGMYHKVLFPFSKWIWNGAAQITATSQGLRALAQTFYSQGDIRVIPNCTDPTIFRPLQSFGSNGKFNILFVGRLTAQKNLIALFEKIIPELLKRDTEDRLQFNVVGEGPLKERLQQIARKSGSSKKVSFMNWVSREELPAVYNENDILILPSVFEGMSNVVLEAKACGLKVAGFKIAGNEEILDPLTDIMIDKGDIEKLIEALANAMQKPKMFLSEDPSKNCSISQIAEKYLSLMKAGMDVGINRTTAD